jgi:hypothetical protein
VTNSENTLAYYDTNVITNTKSYIVLTPWACTIKHYGLVIYGFRSKLACLLKSVKVNDNNDTTLGLFKICLFLVHFESVMFYSTDPFESFLPKIFENEKLNLKDKMEVETFTLMSQKWV